MIRSRIRRHAVVLPAFLLVVAAGATSAFAQSPSFVQVNYATPPSGSTVSVPFRSAQVAGHLNVVIVGWSDLSRTVQSVTDSSGNVYARAVGPTVLGGTASQSIYFAKNIAAAAANANRVTVTFSGSATYPDVRIAEYAGVDTVNPVDVVVGASSQSSTLSNSGPVTTTNANDLLVAGNYVLGVTSGAGSGFTSRVITSPDGDILMDRVVTSVGTYSATAPESSGAWIMQMVAFRAAGGTTPPPAPAITGLAPSSGPVGTSVTLTGSNFGATQGASTVRFNGTLATPTSWSASAIVVPVPTGATTGSVVVVAGGQPSNGPTFTVTTPQTAPVITSVSPSSGPVGTSVTIAGSNFGSTQGSSTVRFNGTLATPTSWSATSIVVPVPTGATTGAVVVTVGALASNGASFTVTVPPSPPAIASLSPSSGPIGTGVTITGTNFGSAQGSSTVRFNGTLATPTSWSATTITVPVPVGATSGAVVVSVGALASNGVPFTVTDGGTARPSLVQQLLVQSNQNFESGNGFINALPNPVLPGNCVILAMTYARKPGRTIAITDNVGTNTWTRVAGPIDDSSGTFTSAIYASFDTKAGTQKVTVTFDAPLFDYQVVMSEWNNVALASALDGSAAAAGAHAPNVSAGTINTSQPGDLVYQYAIDTGWGAAIEGNSFTGYAAGPGFELLFADRRIAVVSQYAIQANAGPINPTFQATGGSQDPFNTLAVALKAAPAGTAPDPSAMRIVSTYHTRVNAGTPKVSFPTRGNLLVATTAYHEDQEHLVAVSDSRGNPWTVVTGSSHSQMAYARNATPGSDLVLTMNVVEHGSGNLQLLLYDVVNADPNPHVKTAYASGLAGNNNPVLLNAPNLTPSHVGGLVFVCLNIHTGPPASMPSPNGVVFDSIYYTGATDLTPQDSGDGYAHIRPTTTAPLTFQWQIINGNQSTGWTGSAWEFKPAIPAGAEPE